jgi:branched-chain amino acid aminotransferase
VFFVMQGRLRTPAVSCGILDGITREVVLQLAKQQHLSVDEDRFTMDDLHRADECFLTNTSMEIMPVTSIDHRPLGSGRPGPVTELLRKAFTGRREQFLEPAS